jgi:hypothetical protein
MVVVPGKSEARTLINIRIQQNEMRKFDRKKPTGMRERIFS